MVKSFCYGGLDCLVYDLHNFKNVKLIYFLSLVHHLRQLCNSLFNIFFLVCSLFTTYAYTILMNYSYNEISWVGPLSSFFSSLLDIVAILFYSSVIYFCLVLHLECVINIFCMYHLLFKILFFFFPIYL